MGAESAAALLTVAADALHADGRYRVVHPPRADDERIRTFAFVRDEPVPMRTLELFLDALARSLGPELLRVKGLVHVRKHPQGPAVVHGAQQLLHGLVWLPERPSDDRRMRIVFITLASAAERIEEGHRRQEVMKTDMDAS